MPSVTEQEKRCEYLRRQYGDFRLYCQHENCAHFSVLGYYYRIEIAGVEIARGHRWPTLEECLKQGQQKVFYLLSRATKDLQDDRP